MLPMHEAMLLLAAGRRVPTRAAAGPVRRAHSRQRRAGAASPPQLRLRSRCRTIHPIHSLCSRTGRQLRRHPQARKILPRPEQMRRTTPRVKPPARRQRLPHRHRKHRQWLTAQSLQQTKLIYIFQKRKGMNPDFWGFIPLFLKNSYPGAGFALGV